MKAKRTTALKALTHTRTVLMPLLTWQGMLGMWVDGSSGWAGCQKGRPESVLVWGPKSGPGLARRGGFGMALWLSHTRLPKLCAWASFLG